MLEELGVTAILSDNCRNSREVVTSTTLMTGADLGTAALGPGPGVDTVVYSTSSEATGLATAKIRSLIGQGVSPADMTLLSAVPYEDSTFGYLPDDLDRMILRLDEHVVSGWPPKSMTFAQISAFKGFENRFILVSDLLDVAGDPRAVASLYVAMSRARVALWVALSQSAEEQLRPVIAANAARIIESREGGGDA